MFDITFSSTTASGASHKRFQVADRPMVPVLDEDGNPVIDESTGDDLMRREPLHVEGNTPYQMQQIIRYGLAYAEQNDNEPFTFDQLAAFIDDNFVGDFTRSKGGTIRIIRYYSKRIQEAGIFIAV